MLVKEHGEADKGLVALAKKTGQVIPKEKPADDTEKNGARTSPSNNAPTETPLVRVTASPHFLVAVRTERLCEPTTSSEVYSHSRTPDRFAASRNTPSLQPNIRPRRCASSKYVAS